MAIWAIADLHLCFGVPEKSMEAFGPLWQQYTDKIQSNWQENVSADDLVLIAGDISWAMKLDQAKVDLDWIDKLAGTKLILKGNHDYWWTSPSKVRSILPPSVHLIQNDVFNWKEVSIGGSRLWDNEEFSYNSYIEFRKGPIPVKTEKEMRDDKTLFEKELGRLELSLSQLNPNAKCKIAMTHYPPIGPEFQPSKASAVLEKYGVNICVFGHLHSLKKGVFVEGTLNGVQYFLTACDYLDFKPFKIIS